MTKITKFKQTEMGKIPEEWEVEKVRDVCEQIFSGGTPDTRKPEYWNGDINWLSSGETGKKFVLKTDRKITKLGVENSSTRLAKKEDVVVAGAGQGHTRGQASFLMIDTYVNQSVVVLRADKEKIKPLFLFYNLTLRYPELRHISDAHSSRGSLTTKLMANLFIQIPKLLEQRAIAKVLSDLDEKIELNNQMNKTLEAIGQVIFKRWFVDFEFPNEQGKPYKSSGGEMVDSELGKIPKRWRVGELNELANLTMGLSPKGNTYNDEGEGLPLLNGAADFSGNLIKPKRFTTSPVRICKEGDLVLCIRATIGNLVFSDGEYCLGRGVASLSFDKDFNKEFLFYKLLSSLNYLISQASGSVIRGLSKPDIENLKIVVPNEDLIKSFHEYLSSSFMRKVVNDSESEGLIQSRDSLLPRLMSGKIRVPYE